MSRFIVKHVPVPEGGHIVADTFALPVRLHAGGVLYNRYERRQPHSAYYANRDDALAVADWLADRAAGYPVNLVLCDPTTMARTPFDTLVDMPPALRVTP